MTSNCLIEPDPDYRERIFTFGPVGWPGVAHVGDGDFSAAIAVALALAGLRRDRAGKDIMVGFGRDAVLGVADKVIDAVQVRRDQALLPRSAAATARGRAATTTPSSPRRRRRIR